MLDCDALSFDIWLLIFANKLILWMGRDLLCDEYALTPTQGPATTKGRMAAFMGPANEMSNEEKVR